MKHVSIIFLAAVSLFACSPDEPDKPAPKDGNNGGDDTTQIVDDTVQVILEDTISRKWEVVNAIHNGSPDYSSKGLELDIRRDGSYTLISTGYIGTWEFLNNKTQVLLDKDQSAYKTTWTLDSISSLYMKVDFKSPFTGGNATWEMRPF